jgi:IS5 family transposase
MKNSYKICNWSQYNKKLINRGSINFLIVPKTILLIKKFKAKSTGGRPQEYSSLLIELLVMLKIQYSLPYRALEGFAKSIFKEELKIPSYSLICKRAKELEFMLEKLSQRRPKAVLLDASGLQVFGEGEWKRKIHGVGRPRKWMKIHIAIDERSQEIIAAILTSSNVGDSSVTEDLLDQSPSSIKVVKADGGYDRSGAREAIKKNKAKALIPPPKNARIDTDNQERNDHAKIIKSLGGDLVARSLWGKLTGYNKRALVETAFSRYKRIFSGKLFSRTYDRQRVENHLKCLILNKMMAG